MLFRSEIPVKPGDQTGELTAEPFFELRAMLPVTEASDLRIVHGLSGILHISLPGESLFWQLRKALLQLFQKRYGMSTGLF